MGCQGSNLAWLHTRQVPYLLYYCSSALWTTSFSFSVINLFDLILEREPEEPEKFLGVEKVEEIQEESKREEDEELEINAEPAPIPANLERLWSFSCDLTKGLNVSSLAWNKTNPVSLQASEQFHF